MPTPIDNCKPPEKPIAASLPSEFYGFPRGTAGRGDQEIQGVLIHCVNDLSEYQRCCPINGANGRPRGIEKASVHYGIGVDGSIQQYVDDADIAWGLGPILAQGASVPTYAVCNNTLTWALTVANPGVAPDAYLIHIAVESAKIRVKGSNIDGNDRCLCAGFDSEMLNEQSRSLVALIAYLAEEYSLTIVEDKINYLQLVDNCSRNECGCYPCIDPLICAIEGYCQPVDNSRETNYKTSTEMDLVFIYGEDQYGQKRKISIEDFMVYVNANLT